MKVGVDERQQVSGVRACGWGTGLIYLVSWQACSAASSAIYPDTFNFEAIDTSIYHRQFRALHSTMLSISDQEAARRCPLLALPRELRLQIYEHLFRTDLQYTVINNWEHTFSSENGFINTPHLNKGAIMIIPWLNLMFTCKAIAMEIRSATREPSFLDNERKRTYVLDLEAARGGTALGATTWRHLPCAPARVHVLKVCYNASSGLRVWGCGDPHGITSGLYQTLNHLIHCGPRLDSKQPLAETMHLKRLHIMVESRGMLEREQEEAHYTMDSLDLEKTTLYMLRSIVRQIVDTGVLRGFVDHIQLSNGDTVLDWTPAEVEGAGIPKCWNKYGFDWGMLLYRSSRSVEPLRQPKQ